jgi:hypothetical protein
VFEAHPEKEYLKREIQDAFIRLISFYKEEFPRTDTSVDFYNTGYKKEIPGTNPPFSTFRGSAVLTCVFYSKTPDPCFVSLYGNSLTGISP